MLKILHHLKINVANIGSTFNPGSKRRAKYVLMLLLPFFAILAQAPFVTVLGQTFLLQRVTPDSICATTTDRAATTVRVSAFLVSFPQNTQFRAELSDENGGFGSPKQIGTGSNSGPFAFRLKFNVHIPDGLPASSLYLIRIVSITDLVTSDSINFTILSSSPPSIEVSTLANASACNNIADGIFTLRVFPRTGTHATATPPYSFEYVAQDGILTGVYTQKPVPVTFNNLAMGTYKVRMSDGNGCLSKILPNIVIGKDGPLGIVLSGWGNPTSCGVANGDITVLDTGGSHSTYRYRISPDGGTTWSAIQSGRRFGGLEAGTYTIEGMDSRGCTATLTKTLNNPKGCFAIAGSTDDLNVTPKNAPRLQAFPNPTTTSFTLNLQSGGKEGVQIIVTDMFGKKLYQTTGSSNRQYTFGSEFKSGVYIVQVIQGKQIQTLKLVKGN